MKSSMLTKIPAGSPAGEILKIIGMIIASFLIDKVSELVKESKEDINIIDANFKEV